MARQKNKTLPKSSDTLIDRGAMALQNARYKDAVIIYKQLLKLDPRDEWKHGLAKAYQGRASELGRKGLYDEALSVLDNALDHDPSIKICEDFVHWSILAGRFEAAINRFLSLRNHLDKDELDRVESIFALALLSKNDEAARFFPEDSRLNKDLPTVRQAIQAYCRSDDRTLCELLGQISFHSPYRDIRSILSALSSPALESADAHERLSRISEKSAFNAAARVVEQALSKSPDIANRTRFSAPAQDFIATIQGIDSRACDLAERISKASVTSSKNLFNLLINDPLCQTNGVVRELCHRLLVHYPYGIRAYEKKFKALEKFEIYRIHALSFEKKDDYANATKAWTVAAETMAQQPENPKNQLIRALFLRRAANCAQSGDYMLSSNANNFLEESLKFDPNDLETYHRLFKIYKRSNAGNYNACVERAVKQFPEDSEVLLVAIEQAIVRNAFKKAISYAKTLLSLDPINHRARALVIKAHLSHAAKQISQNKFELAVKEIDAAQGFDAANRPSGLIPIYRGLLEYAQNKEAQGEVMIDLACKAIGNYLCGYFKTAVEMTRLKIVPRYRKKYLNLLKNESQNPPDITIFLALIDEIQHLSNETGVDMAAAVNGIKKYLSAASSLKLGCEETEMVCETFQSSHLYQPLMDFAQVAVKRWPNKPIFDYFVVYARSRGVARNMSPLDLQRLEDAIDEAEEQKNHRAANRMIDYLDSGLRHNLLNDAGFPDKLDELIEQILNEYPDAANILDPLLDFNEQNFPEKPRKARRKSVP